MGCTKLSHISFNETFSGILSSLKRDRSQIVSEAVFARDLYSISIDNLAITLFFFQTLEYGISSKESYIYAKVDV